MYRHVGGVAPEEHRLIPDPLSTSGGVYVGEEPSSWGLDPAFVCTLAKGLTPIPTEHRDPLTGL